MNRFALSTALMLSPFAADVTAADPAAVDATERRELIVAVGAALKAEYIDPQLAQAMASAIAARAKHHAYDAISDPQALADALKTDLRAVSHDEHLWLGYHPEGAQDEPESLSVAELDTWRDRAAADNFGFRRVSRLDGNVGYVDFHVFVYPYLSAPTAAAAMGLIAHTDALIVDLRRNIGGDPSMVAYLLSFLFDERTHVNDLRYRRDNRIAQAWTTALPPPVFGGRKPVYVLTSHDTFSAAEDFTYALQSLKRATVVGETTGGGAHPAREFKVTEHFTVAIPYAESVSPITHTNWERTGVKPDVAAPAADAFHVAYRAALSELLRSTSDAGRREALQKTLDAESKTPSSP